MCVCVWTDVNTNDPPPGSIAPCPLLLPLAVDLHEYNDQNKKKKEKSKKEKKPTVDVGELAAVAHHRLREQLLVLRSLLLVLRQLGVVLGSQGG